MGAAASSALASRSSRKRVVKYKLQAVLLTHTAEPAAGSAEAVAPSSAAEAAAAAPAKAKKAPTIHKGCFDYVKSMNDKTPELVKSVVCCTAMLASGKKVTDLKEAQKFCKNKNAALKAVQAFDAATADPKLIEEAARLFGKAHEDMEEVAKKSRVVAEMGEWNRSAMGK